MIVEVAEANQTDGYRMVTALVRRKLGRTVNRKRVLRVMRGRIRAIASSARLERAAGSYAIHPGELVLGTDNGPAFTARHQVAPSVLGDPDRGHVQLPQLAGPLDPEEAGPFAPLGRPTALDQLPAQLELPGDDLAGAAVDRRRFKLRLAELGIAHRRGGYRDPESQAFIESWFGKLKEREVWLNEYETLNDDARRGIGGYVDRYHHRPHSGLDYRTPLEVRQTWEDLQKLAA